MPVGPIHGVGRDQGWGIAEARSTAEVNRWLAPGMELGEQSVTATGTHPVVTLFGLQTNVGLNVLPWPRIRYHEVATIVPFVRVSGLPHAYAGPYVYSPSLFLNRWLPIISGRIFLGLRKAKATIIEVGGVYDVNDSETGQPLQHCEGFATQGGDGLLAALTPLLQQPVVSEFRNGDLVYDGFDWNLGAASLGAADLLVRTWDYAAMTLECGVRERRYESALDITKGYGFWFDANWTMTLPRKSSVGLEAFNQSGVVYPPRPPG
jgi:hypothetical protein